MGFKQWLAKHTTKPSDFARTYASGLVELIDHLTASLVAFSGKKSILDENHNIEMSVFENHSEMIKAGFDPFDTAIGGLIAPNIEKIEQTVDSDFLHSTFKYTTAFLCLYSENAAHKHMKPENATLFSSALYCAIAERTAGRFGFISDPRQVAKTINELLPLFRCDRLLNKQTIGKDDVFGSLIKHISFLQGGSTQYGFVVGSEKQPLGCATAMLKVVIEIDDSLKRCAKDLNW